MEIVFQGRRLQCGLNDLVRGTGVNGGSSKGGKAEQTNQHQDPHGSHVAALETKFRKSAK
jgi:hypothetical protein